MWIACGKVCIDGKRYVVDMSLRGPTVGRAMSWVILHSVAFEVGKGKLDRFTFRTNW